MSKEPFERTSSPTQYDWRAPVSWWLVVHQAGPAVVSCLRVRFVEGGDDGGGWMGGGVEKVGKARWLVVGR